MTDTLTSGVFTPMGNQQATVIDLAWLAGFWDGEGCISLYDTNPKGSPKLQVSLNVVNTNIVLINHADKILRSLGCSFHIQERKYPSPKHKDAYQLITRNRDYCYRTLQALHPYLIGKLAQCELAMRFIERRDERSKTYCGWSDDDYDTLTEIRRLNKRGKPEAPTTARETPDTLGAGDDTVCSHMKV